MKNPALPMTPPTCNHCGQAPRDPLGFRRLLECAGLLWCYHCAALRGATIAKVSGVVSSANPKKESRTATSSRPVMTPAARAELVRQAGLSAAAERDCTSLRQYLRGWITTAQLAAHTHLPAPRVRAMIARMDKQGYRIARIAQPGSAAYLYRLDAAP